MKLTYQELINLSNTLLKMSYAKLPFKTAYKIQKMLREIAPDVEFYNTSIQELIEKYAMREEDGSVKFQNNNPVIKEELINECNLKLNEIVTTEVEAPEIYFAVEELETLSCSAEEISALIPFIKE